MRPSLQEFKSGALQFYREDSGLRTTVSPTNTGTSRRSHRSAGSCDQRWRMQIFGSPHSTQINCPTGNDSEGISLTSSAFGVSSSHFHGPPTPTSSKLRLFVAGAANYRPFKGCALLVPSNIVTRLPVRLIVSVIEYDHAVLRSSGGHSQRFVSALHEERTKR